MQCLFLKKNQYSVCFGKSTKLMFQKLMNNYKSDIWAFRLFNYLKTFLSGYDFSLIFKLLFNTINTFNRRIIMV